MTKKSCNLKSFNIEKIISDLFNQKDNKKKKSKRKPKSKKVKSINKSRKRINKKTKRKNNKESVANMPARYSYYM